MDPSLSEYSSAIKIDYNVHRLEHLTVEDNMADGVLVTKVCVYCSFVFFLWLRNYIPRIWTLSWRMLISLCQCRSRRLEPFQSVC